MPYLELVAQAIDFIEDNLQRAITIADVAGAASYSLYHFCRTFNQATHHTPYDYLMRRRLAEAAAALLHSDHKLIDIALDYQFNAPETFSRAFKRVFDMQPNQLRKQGCLDRRRLMPRLTLAHLEHISKGDYLRPLLEEKDAVQVAGVMTLVKNAPATIEVWQWLDQELKNSEVIEPSEYYGLTYYPDDWEERGLLYMAAIPAQSVKTASPALAMKTIPAQQHARFVHKGSTQDLPLTLDYVYHTWAPQTERRVSYSLVVERSRRNFSAADNPEFEREVYIPLG